MVGSLWFYSKDEATSFNNDIENTGDFKSFTYKPIFWETLKAMQQMKSYKSQ